MSETSVPPRFLPRSLLQELLLRKRAQTSLAKFIDYRQAGINPAAHHRLLIDHLEAVERGEVERLMVCMPPGSAKSTYTSVEFPAWFLGRNSQKAVIAASHTQELAERFGRRVRNIVASSEFGRVFEVGLADDSQAAGRWDTNRGGEYFAAGVGGSITGRRADLAIIDDPVKSREDADSDRSREKSWDWYTNDLLTRLKPGAKQIVVMTRWHENDLGGRILEREANRWTLVELAMEAHVGDPLGRAPGARLWPEWFTADMVATAKLDRRGWNALYQQRPSPDEGTFFQKAWFQTWETRPKFLSIYGTSDYAVTDGGGDWTVHRVWGVDQNGHLYRLGGWCGQTSSDVWIERLIDLFSQWKPLAWFGESGVIQKAIEPMLKRRMVERGEYCRLEWLPSISDKATRARGFQSRAALGRVWFEQNADIDEFLKFPAGTHDDDVDCASLIGRALDDAHPAVVPVTPKAKYVDRWDWKMNKDDEEADSWKVS